MSKNDLLYVAFSDYEFWWWFKWFLFSVYMYKLLIRSNVSFRFQVVGIFQSINVRKCKDFDQNFFFFLFRFIIMQVIFDKMCPDCKWAKHVVWLAMFIHSIVKTYWSIFLCIRMVCSFIQFCISFASIQIYYWTYQSVLCFLWTYVQQCYMLNPQCTWYLVSMYLICIWILKSKCINFPSLFDHYI